MTCKIGSKNNDCGTASFYNDYPAWSPDGKKIVFISDASGVGNAASRGIYTMNKDGSEAKRLTNNGYEDNHPRFVTPRKP